MHYKNGRLAKIGDPVIGSTYNRKGIQVGILVGITAGTDTCNCRVAMVDVKEASDVAWNELGRCHRESLGDGTSHMNFLVPTIDYSQCNHLLHADDAARAASLPEFVP